MTKLFLIAAALLTVASAPAVAREGRPVAVDTSHDADASASAPASAAAAAHPNQRYCVVSTPTGSHISRRFCQTREQWLVDGFDPLAKN